MPPILVMSPISTLQYRFNNENEKNFLAELCAPMSAFLVAIVIAILLFDVTWVCVRFRIYVVKYVIISNMSSFLASAYDNI